MDDTTTSRAGTIDFATINIPLDDAKPADRPPFPGIVTIDTFEEGRVYGPGDSGVAWHYAVKADSAEKPFHAWIPLKYAKDKESGAFYDGISKDNNGNVLPVKYTMYGEFGKVLNTFREVYGAKDSEGNTRMPGHAQFVGLTGFFLRKTMTYGKDPVTGELRNADGKPSLIAVKAPKGAVIQSAVATVTYTEAETELALAILDGKKPLEYQKGLIQRKDISADLKNGILDGSVAKYLVAQGLATQDGSVIRSTAVTA